MCVALRHVARMGVVVAIVPKTVWHLVAQRDVVAIPALINALLVTSYRIRN